MSASASSTGALEKLDAGRTGYASQDFPSSFQGKEADGNGTNQDMSSIETPTPNADEYPKGIPLLFLVMAFALGTFMVALDNVCFSTLAGG